MKIAVTGAHGWVGSALCAHLLASGHTLRRITRRQSAAEDVIWDFSSARDASGLVQPLRGCEAVIHCAAHVHRPRETPAEAVLFHKVNVEGTRQVVQAAESAGVAKFLLVSTTALYRWDGACPKKEESPLSLDSAYARSKHEAEEIVSQAKLDWRIARLATVYGPGDHANFLRLAQALQKRRFFLPGAALSQKSVLPVTSASELLARLAILPEPCHRLVNLASPLSPTLREICGVFSAVCSFPEARTLPVPLLQFAAGIGDLLGRVTPGFPLDSTVLKKLTTATVVCVERQQLLFPDFAWLDFRRQMSKFGEFYRGAANA